MSKNAEDNDFLTWYWATCFVFLVLWISNPISAGISFWVASYSVRVPVLVGAQNPREWAAAFGIVAGILASGVGTILIFHFLLGRLGISISHIWGEMPDQSQIMVGIFLGGGLGCLASLTVGGFGDSHPILMARVITQGLIVAVVEEFLFRGVLLKSMLRSFTRTSSVAFSSMLFLLPHLFLAIPPIGLFFVLLLGVASSILWLRWRRLTVCCLLHVAYNLCTII